MGKKHTRLVGLGYMIHFLRECACCTCFIKRVYVMLAPNHPSPVVCSNPSSDKSKAKKVISFFFNHTKPFVELVN